MQNTEPRIPLALARNLWSMAWALALLSACGTKTGAVGENPESMLAATTHQVPQEAPLRVPLSASVLPATPLPDAVPLPSSLPSTNSAPVVNSNAATFVSPLLAGTDFAPGATRQPSRATTSLPQGPQNPQAPSNRLQDPVGRPSGLAPRVQSPASSAPSKEQELLLRSARNALALGQPDEACNLFESYLMQRTGDHEVRAEYAGVLVQRGQLDKARELFRVAVEALPTATDIRHKLVNVLIMSGEYAATTSQLEEILRLNPDDISAAAMLCRTSSWVKDLEKAKQVFDQYLRRLDRTNPKDLEHLALALLDMQKPSEALPILLELHAKAPMELEWLSSLVYCYQLLGDGQKAGMAVEMMSGIQPTVTDARLHLVEQLVALGNYQLAQQIIQQVLKASPSHNTARLLNLRIVLESVDVRRAAELLNEFAVELGGMRQYSLSKAFHHQLIGQWNAAKGVLEAMLVERPDDDEVRIRLAMLLRERGDMHQALAELSKVPTDSAYQVMSQLERATTLTLQGSPAAAVGLCTRLAEQRPNDVAPVLAMVRAQLEMGHTAEAQSMCKRFIEAHPSDKLAIAQVRVMQGMSLLAAGDGVQAAQSFQAAMREPSLHDPEAFHGLIVARSRGDLDVSSELTRLTASIAASGEGNRMRVELAKHALGDHDYARATAYLSKALRWQPDNQAAMVLLGEAYNLAAKAGEDKDPIRLFATMLNADAGNTRARLGLARAYAARRQFTAALENYKLLLDQDSSYDYVGREYARALYWDRQFDRSFAEYERLIARLPSNGLAVDFFEDPVDGFTGHALADFESNSHFRKSLELELAAKREMQWRMPKARAALQELVTREPTNQEALFDLAQTEHRAGLIKKAVSHYQELLKTASGHQEASTALRSAERQLMPKANLRFESQDRNGRDGLSYMTESSAIADLVFPMGDKDDLIGFGVGTRDYSPGTTYAPAPVPTDPGIENLTASVARLLISKRVADSTVIDAKAEFASYDLDSAFHDRAYFDVGLTYISEAQTTAKLRLFSDPVAENFRTLELDIHRLGARFGVELAMSRRLDLGLSGYFASYAGDEDHSNTRAEGNAFIAYEFNPAPQELRALIKADFINSSEESEFPASIQQNFTLRDMEVPYFAPSGYSVLSLQGDWRHQLGDQWFTGSDDMYYGITARVALDSNSASYAEVDLSAGYQMTEWFRLEGGFQMLRSSEIDITGAYMLLSFCWP